jgi:hypothetical protein
MSVPLFVRAREVESDLTWRDSSSTHEVVGRVVQGMREKELYLIRGESGA